MCKGSIGTICEFSEILEIYSLDPYAVQKCTSYSLNTLSGLLCMNYCVSAAHHGGEQSDSAEVPPLLVPVEALSPRLDISCFASLLHFSFIDALPVWERMAGLKSCLYLSTCGAAAFWSRGRLFFVVSFHSFNNCIVHIQHNYFYIYAHPDTHTYTDTHIDQMA